MPDDIKNDTSNNLQSQGSANNSQATQNSSALPKENSLNLDLSADIAQSKTSSLDKLLLENQKLVQFSKRPSTSPASPSQLPTSPAVAKPTPQTPPASTAVPPVMPTATPPVVPTAPKTLQQVVQSQNKSTSVGLPARPVTPGQLQKSETPVVSASPVVQAPKITNQSPQVATELPKTPISQDRKFSTSIRTMKDDIELLKKGVLSVPTKPNLITIRPPTQIDEIKTGSIEPQLPKINPINSQNSPPDIIVKSSTVISRPIDASQKETINKIPQQPSPILSNINKTMPEPTIPPLPGATPTIPPIQPPSSVSPPTPAIPPKPASGPTLPNLSGGPSLPPIRGGSSVGIKPLYIVIVIMLVGVLGIGIYFIATNGGGAKTTTTPTPFNTVVASPTPLSLSQLNQSFSALSLKVKPEDTIANLKALLRSYNAQQGQLVAFLVQDATTSQKLSLGAFLSKFGVQLPNDPNINSLNTDDFIYGFYAQQETDPNSQRPVALRPYIVAKVNNLQSLQQYLQVWESTMVQSLSDILDSSNSIAQFSQDFINGTPFKYIPDANKGIAFTIIDQYLVITSSRDSFRAVTSKVFSSLITQSPDTISDDSGIKPLDIGQ